MSAKTSLIIAAISTLAMMSLGTGCIEDDRTFIIRQNQVPVAGCLLTNTSTIYNPRGMLDVSAKQGYFLFPLLENHLISTTSTDQEPDRNALHVRGFDVEIDLGQIPGEYPANLLKFWYPTSGYLPSSGQLTSVVKVIPDRLVQLLNIPPAIQPLVMVSVKATAKHGGDDKDSSTFVYPIVLCTGCLVDSRSSCPADPSKDKTVLYNSCGFPQDKSVTCCTASGALKCYASTKK